MSGARETGWDADDYREHREEQQKVKERRRLDTIIYLKEHNVPYEELDGIYHLAVLVDGKRAADLWPSSGKWFIRATQKRGRYVSQLVRSLGLPA